MFHFFMQMLHKNVTCLIKSKLLQNNYDRSWSYAIFAVLYPVQKKLWI